MEQVRNSLPGGIAIDDYASAFHFSLILLCWYTAAFFGDCVAN
jgi:hypothetical protein